MINHFKCSDLRKGVHQGLAIFHLYQIIADNDLCSFQVAYILDNYKRDQSCQRLCYQKYFIISEGGGLVVIFSAF
jgi:hypothetical protein